MVLFVFSTPAPIFAKVRKDVALFPEGHRWALVVRSILSSSNLVIHYYGLKHLPLADANLIAGLLFYGLHEKSHDNKVQTKKT